MPSDEATALVRLRGLLEVTRLVRTEDDVSRLLAADARTISESLGFRTVVINLYRPAWDDFYVSMVHGNEEARALLVGDAQGWDVWEPLLADRFERRGAYLVPSGEFDWDADGVKSYVPEFEPGGGEDAWDPQDALLVPMPHSDGHLLGILSLDEPALGRRPSDEELDVLVAVARHAALAVQSAQEAAEAARHRDALEQLLEISARLTESFAVDSILQAVCDGISGALGFQKVAAELVDPETGVLRPEAAAGWDLREPALNGPTRLDDVRPLFDRQFEIAGCFLLPREEAERRLPPSDRVYRSVMNGRGPHAWNHHWLIVPLYDRAGGVTGVIWADEPEDRLLPSKERLQALRVFANQATAALASAAQYAEVRFLADHDPLTKLSNRRAFMRELERETVRSRRYATEFALVLFDLDMFKAVNDGYGHLAGDEALVWVAEVLTEEVRRSDRAFRVGGDEFALILPAASRFEAADFVSRVAAALDANTDARFSALSASFGVAVFPHDGSDEEALLRVADESMYEGKALGADRAKLEAQ